MLGLAAPACAGRADCLLAWHAPGATADETGARAACVDGETCDLDAAADGACTIPVSLCVDLPGCGAGAAGSVTIRGRGSAAVSRALAGLGAPGASGRCTADTAVRVALGGQRQRTVTLRAWARSTSGQGIARQRLRLICIRAARARPAFAKAVVVTTDFETGLLATVGVGRPHDAVRFQTPINSDAVMRTAGGVPYVVNRFLGDNLQVLDPRTLATRLQCSTGPGSNPHDVAVVDAHKAYVTRYNEAALWIVDPGAPSCAGFFRGAIDLSPYADADGLPEMDQMALVGERLFVSLELLDRNNGFKPAGPSKLVVIDVASEAVVNVITLTGANAFNETSGLGREPGTGKLIIGEVGDFFRVGDGGLERVDPVTLHAEGWFVTETALGGNITDAVLVSPTKGYAIVFVPENPPRNDLVSFDPSHGTLLRRLYTSTYNLPEVVRAPDDTVWLADQSLPAPGIRIFDSVTDRQLTSSAIDVGLPPFSMAFLP